MSTADRDSIIRKVKKCLRLSASANEHEAAAALRQARALMNEHGLTEAEILAAGATEALGKSGSSRKPPNWEARLAAIVAAAFGCEMIFVSSYTGGSYAFIGCGGAAEIAQHAYIVLVRRCRKARTEYIARKLKRCGPASRTARADVYCLAWVCAVEANVKAFAKTPAEVQAIEAYVNQHFGETQTFTPLNRTQKALKPRTAGDWIAGQQDGQDVTLQNPIATRERDALPGSQA